METLPSCDTIREIFKIIRGIPFCHTISQGRCWVESLDTEEDKVYSLDGHGMNLIFWDHLPCCLITPSWSSSSHLSFWSCCFFGGELRSKADKNSHGYCPVAVCIFQPIPLPAASRHLIRELRISFANRRIKRLTK